MAKHLPIVTPVPIPLDSLLARAGALAQPHLASRPTRAVETAADLHPHADADTPRSLLLTVTVSHCTSCHASTRHVAPYVLVRYAENAHTVHYRATGPDAVRPELFATLPRERRETHVDVPYCEECF